MSDLTTQQDYERAASLREEIMSFLEQHLCRATTQRDSSVIVGLQDAANRMGQVERCLLSHLPAMPRLHS
jgi:hypothetical protein